VQTSHFIAEGCTWSGNPVLVDGKPIACSHRHKSASGAQACISRLRKEHFGDCETYRVVEVVTSPFLTTGMRTVIKKVHV
jgi:hypothetical protein